MHPESEGSIRSGTGPFLRFPNLLYNPLPLVLIPPTPRFQGLGTHPNIQYSSLWYIQVYREYSMLGRVGWLNIRGRGISPNWTTQNLLVVSMSSSLLKAHFSKRTSTFKSAPNLQPPHGMKLQVSAVDKGSRGDETDLLRASSSQALLGDSLGL